MLHRGCKWSRCVRHLSIASLLNNPIQFRAKNDLYNGVAAGCITGGALAAKAGPQAAALGCAGFAGFSAAIDYYMRMPNDDTAADPIA